MEEKVLHLKLMRWARGVPLAYEVRQHIKASHISPGYSAYLNLDEEMIAKAPIVDAKLNLKQTQECLDRAHVSWECDTFKINNTLVYHMLSKVFMDMDAYDYVKQRKSMQDG